MTRPPPGCFLAADARGVEDHHACGLLERDTAIAARHKRSLTLQGQSAAVMVGNTGNEARGSASLA